MIRVTLCTIQIPAWNLINFLFQHLLNLHCTGFLDSTRAEKIKSSLRNSVLLYLLYGKMRSRREKQENHFWSIIVIILLLFFACIKCFASFQIEGWWIRSAWYVLEQDDPDVFALNFICTWAFWVWTSLPKEKSSIFFKFYRQKVSILYSDQKNLYLQAKFGASVDAWLIFY